jgi:hypothetical protein
MTDITPKPTRTPRASKPKKAAKRGRSNPDLLPFEEAREYIRSEMIESRSNFETWWQRNQPKTIPRFPYRAYEKKGWVSWNDFLGVNNEFVGKKVAKWRHFEDAVKWVHALRLETQADWTRFAKTVDKPEDIPHRPDLVYAKWTSWNHWLGNKPSERIKIAEENQGVFYIIHEEGFPSNVLTYGVEPGGLTALKSRWERSPYEIVKFFKNKREKTEEVSKVINALTTEYQGYAKQRITPNIWEVIWYIQMQLEIISNLSVDQPTKNTLNGLMPIQQLRNFTE